ncbi:nucleotide exchange factor GrpE [Candidatus Woesearchaeota archaeon]|nr:nucleotide exchange factor GrpE [Candidatus Woesearchaeota archaeon]
MTKHKKEHKKKARKEEVKEKSIEIEDKEKHKKEDKEAKIKELTETLQRVQAEFENYKKRCEKDMSNFAKCANQELMKKLLAFIDDFELALKNCRAKDDFYKGIELIYSHLIEALHSQGLKHIECVDKKFDPYYHEALLTEESDKEENTVLEEMQKGYVLNDKVIRHSKVKVAKRKIK